MTETWVVIENGVVVEDHGAERLVPWWSFTKTVLAAAALVLVRDGLASLDEPLPDKPYTLRHLLQHRSGLPDYGGLSAYHEAVARGDEPWAVPDLLRHVDAERLRYAAGQGWDYSNIGYLYVRQMIETITGESIDSALHRLVMHPLEVEGPRVAMQRDDLATVAMGGAQPYHPAWVYHGLLVGGVRHAAVLLQSLMAGMLLPSEILREMLEPFVLHGPMADRPWRQPGYGLGLMIGEVTGGRKVAGHTGGGPGSTIAVYHSLDRKDVRRTAVCFATSEDPARTEERAFALL